MEKIKAIKSTEKLCWKCLQEKDNIHKIEFGPLGYGSAFDCCSTKIQLCDECYKASCPEIWSDELVYDNEDCKEYDWSHYKYEDEMFEYFESLPIEGKQLVMNEYWMGDHFMEPQDWIDYELGILPHEKAKEYGLYSIQEIAAYEERFPKCKWPANRIYSDGSKGCWCPFGASGNYNQEIGSNIAEECYGCPYYEERNVENIIRDIPDKDFNDYEILSKASIMKSVRKNIEVLLFHDFDLESLPHELLEVAEHSNDLLKIRGKDVINRIREIAYQVEDIPSNRKKMELCKHHMIVYDKKNDVYLYFAKEEKNIREIKIVIVDASKDWTIINVEQKERILYIKPIHPSIGFCKLI